MELVNDEHVCGCGQASCDINAAYENGFGLWAVYLFSNSGAASDEFMRLFKRLPKRRFNIESERERKAFVKNVEHLECMHCNAVVWESEFCDNCGNHVSKTKENENE